MTTAFIPLRYIQLAAVFGIGFIATGVAWWIGKKVTPTVQQDRLWGRILSPGAALLVLAALYFSFAAAPGLEPVKSSVDKAAIVAFTVLLSVILVRVLSTLIGQWLNVRQEFSKTPEVLTNVVAVTVYAIALLMILSYFGINITPLITTVGIGGLAVGLALKDTLSNFFAGLHLISDKPIRIGDFVELENGQVSGHVEDIGWRSTRIRTLKNTAVVVPNAKLAESTITNDSMPEEKTRFWVDVGVAYTEDLAAVEEVVVDVATQLQKEQEEAVTDFEPFVRYRQFADSNINFRVILEAEQPLHKYVLTHRFVKNLHSRFAEEDIEISWPVRKVYYGNTPEDAE